jgi:hypothetical protein
VVGIVVAKPLPPPFKGLTFIEDKTTEKRTYALNGHGSTGNDPTNSNNQVYSQSNAETGTQCELTLINKKIKKTLTIYKAD